jgi:hypothetical protein
MIEAFWGKFSDSGIIKRSHFCFLKTNDSSNTFFYLISKRGLFIIPIETSDVPTQNIPEPDSFNI